MITAQSEPSRAAIQTTSVEAHDAAVLASTRALLDACRDP